MKYLEVLVLLLGIVDRGSSLEKRKTKVAASESRHHLIAGREKIFPERRKFASKSKNVRGLSGAFEGLFKKTASGGETIINYEDVGLYGNRTENVRNNFQTRKGATRGKPKMDKGNGKHNSYGKQNTYGPTQSPTSNNGNANSADGESNGDFGGSGGQSPTHSTPIPARPPYWPTTATTPVPATPASFPAPTSIGQPVGLPACQIDNKGNYGLQVGDMTQVDFRYQMEIFPGMMTEPAISQIEHELVSLMLPEMFPDQCRSVQQRQATSNLGGYVGISLAPPDSLASGCKYTLEKNGESFPSL